MRLSTWDQTRRYWAECEADRLRLGLEQCLKLCLRFLGRFM